MKSFAEQKIGPESFGGSLRSSNQKDEEMKTDSHSIQSARPSKMEPLLEEEKVPEFPGFSVINDKDEKESIKIAETPSLEPLENAP